MIGGDDDDLQFLRPFQQYFSPIRTRKGEHERLCAMKRRLGSERILPPARFKPETSQAVGYIQSGVGVGFCLGDLLGVDNK